MVTKLDMRHINWNGPVYEELVNQITNRVTHELYSKIKQDVVAELLIELPDDIYEYITQKRPK